MKELVSREEVILTRSLTMMGVIMCAGLVVQHPTILAIMRAPLKLEQVMLSTLFLALGMCLILSLSLSDYTRKMVQSFMPSVLNALPSKVSVASLYLTFYGIILTQADLSVLGLGRYGAWTVMSMFIVTGFVGYVTAGLPEAYHQVVMPNEYKEGAYETKQYFIYTFTDSVSEVGKTLFYPILTLFK